MRRCEIVRTCSALEDNIAAHLADDVAVEVHDDEAALGRGHVDLEVVRGPGAAGDGGLAGQHGGPVPLPRHRAHQHEPVLTHGGSQHKRSVERRDAFK